MTANRWAVLPTRGMAYRPVDVLIRAPFPISKYAKYDLGVPPNMKIIGLYLNYRNFFSQLKLFLLFQPNININSLIEHKCVLTFLSK